ncbi:MAG: hypothetical protein AAF551_04415 [Bacteroidota bacterium]
MDIVKLNKLVGKLSLVKSHLDTAETDPLLMEAYEECRSELEAEFGGYLEQLLWETHDEFCEDFEVQNIEAYVSAQGVDIEAEDFPGMDARLHLKAEPLRMMMADRKARYEEELWRVV